MIGSSPNINNKHSEDDKSIVEGELYESDH